MEQEAFLAGRFTLCRRFVIRLGSLDEAHPSVSDCRDVTRVLVRRGQESDCFLFLLRPDVLIQNSRKPSNQIFIRLLSQEPPEMNVQLPFRRQTLARRCHF